MLSTPSYGACSLLNADGRDLAFVTVRVVDKNGIIAPHANNPITFTLEGPGEIVAKDSGDATILMPFPFPNRAAFNGLCLAIVRAKPGWVGNITLRAESPALLVSSVSLQSVTAF